MAFFPSEEKGGSGSGSSSSTTNSSTSLYAPHPNSDLLQPSPLNYTMDCCWMNRPPREQMIWVEKQHLEHGLRIAFRTKSEVEMLDDGFNWRKYGKKSVKNSPNPRNYYRCSTKGCSVKKRVEKDREDSSYVTTTYDGIHNHSTPGVVYYTS